MKNSIVAFLIGAILGAGGTFLWLHKRIKKELASIEKSASDQADNADDLPFVMGEKEGQKSREKAENDASVAVNNERKKELVAYDKVTGQYENGAVAKKEDVLRPPVPIAPREEEKEDPEKDYEPIDDNQWKFENEYGKSFLIFYGEDRVMADEDGTIIAKPAQLVGTRWEMYVGKYLPMTSFVRNKWLMKDYQIKVEHTSYIEEYGSYDYRRED